MKSRNSSERSAKSETKATKDFARHSSPILGSLQINSKEYKKQGERERNHERSVKLNVNRSSNSSDISVPGHSLHTDSGISSSDSLASGEKRCSSVDAEQDFVSELMKIADTKLAQLTTKDDVSWNEGDLDLQALKQIVPVQPIVRRRHEVVLPVLGSIDNDIAASTSSIFMTAMDADVTLPENYSYLSDNLEADEKCNKQSEKKKYDIDQNDARLYCSSCGDIINDPRLLPCLHTFCTDCLQTKVRHKEEADSYSAEHAHNSHHSEFSSEILDCPTCFTKVDLPLEGVYALPVNHMIQRLLILHNLQTGKVNEITCDLCPDNSNIEAHCICCSVNMCKFCFQAHKRQSLTAAHTVILASDVDKEGNRPNFSAYKSRQSSIPMMCQRHTNEELRLYCMDCSQLVCRDCCLGSKHRDHKCEYLNHVIDNKVSEISTEYKSCKARIQSLERAISSLELSEKTIETIVEEISGKVERHIDSYIRSLEKHRSTLLASVQGKAKAKRDSVITQKENLTKALIDVSHSCEFATQLLNVGNNHEILSMKPYVVRRLKNLAEIPLNDKPKSVDNFMEFKANKKVKAWIDGDMASALGHNKRSSKLLRPGLEVDICGDIVSHSVEPRKSVAHGEGIHCSRVKLPSEFIVLAKNFEGEKLENGGNEVTVSVNMDGVDSNLFRKPKVQITDRQDGTYRVLYIVYAAGNYSLDVTISGEPIHGSPFHITALDAKAHVHSGIFHCCCFCSSGGDKISTCACGAVMPGGYKGCGHGYEGHPGTPHWSCCGKTTEASSCGKQFSSMHHNNVPTGLPPQYPRMNFQSNTLPLRLNAPRNHPLQATPDNDMYATANALRLQRSGGVFQPSQYYSRKQSVPGSLTKQIKTVTL